LLKNTFVLVGSESTFMVQAGTDKIASLAGPRLRRC